MDDIRLNSKVEMIDLDENSINGTLYEMDDEFLYISIGAVKPGVKFLRSGDRVDLLIYDDKNLYSLEGAVVSRETNGVMMYKVQTISDPIRIQRRKFVRYPYKTKVMYTSNREALDRSIAFIRRQMSHDLGKLDIRNGKSEDISSGGMRLKTWENLKEGQLLVLSMPLGVDQILTKGQIVHKYSEMSSEAAYYYGIKFIGMSESEMDKIMRFIFKLMREQIRR